MLLSQNNEKDPLRLYGYSILPLMLKKTSARCLDCNTEVSAKVKSVLGRDETVFIPPQTLFVGGILFSRSRKLCL